MNNSKIKLSFLFGIFLSLTIFFGARIILAGSVNIPGYAWSSNTGWTKLDVCDANGNCFGAYGVTLLTEAPGTVSGYAWSSNIGWITFNDPSCPTSVAGCTPGAYVDWDHPNSDGSVNVKGWARACSVYENGDPQVYGNSTTTLCSGPLKDNALRGNWDGFINLSDTANHKWGVVVMPDSSIKGYAWGSDVMGWIYFNAKIPVNAAITDFNTDQSCVANATAPNLTWDTTGVGSCTLGLTGDTSKITGVSSKAAGGTLGVDGKFYVPGPVVTSGASSITLTCDKVSQTLVVSICLPNTTPTPTPVAPTCPAGTVLNSASGTCEDATNSCPTGSVLNPASGLCEAVTCPVNTVLNKTTGQCVQKKKTIYKES